MVSSTLIQNSSCRETQTGCKGRAGRDKEEEGGAGLTEQQPWRRQTPRGGRRTEHSSSRHRQQHEHRPISSSVPRPAARVQLLIDGVSASDPGALSRSLALGNWEVGFTAAERGPGNDFFPSSLSLSLSL